MNLESAVVLGEGAMGRVLRSYDEELQREVALKILRSDDSEAVTRFLREARSQARVDHPNVAKVYEVGYRDGRPCIAMQLVEGRPLDAALDGRPLEEKVRVLRTVARAVHAAHEVGLIHRDLKPSNVLVEDHGGELVPFVLDFGIARTLEDSEFTVAGQALGTPGYMSPEQARGDLGALDRRSDVFSLGVVLYEVLADRKPFAARSALESMVQVLHGEAPPLGRVAPTLPVDLRAIVERCLEKRPGRRYPSARALAEDLDRWLRGQPVEARPVTVTERWLRKARQNPLAATLVLVALLLALVLGVWAWITEARSARRAEFARELGQTVERLESTLRLSHLSPAHDVRPTQARIEWEIDSIAERAKWLPRSLQGPALYARARGLMALDHWREALPLLEQARRSLPGDAAVVLALGRVLSERYAEEVDASLRIDSAQLRAAALEDARTRYADRARDLLQQARTSSDLRPHESAFVEGLLALLGGELEVAALAGAEASQMETWFYDGDLLRAEALLRRAEVARADGLQTEAEQALDEARQAAEQAARVGRSDPAAATTLCRVHGRELDLRSDRADSLDQVQSAYDAARSACDQALRLDADHWPALAQLADIGWRMGQTRARTGEEPVAELEAAVESALRGLELVESPRLLAHLGSIYWVWGNWLRDQGGDSETRYRQALDAMEEATARSPGDPYLWLRLAHAYTQYGLDLHFAAMDPTEAWTRAEAALERGLESPGAFAGRLHEARCGMLSHWGYHLQQRGDDPSARYQTSVEACRSALDIDPMDLSARGNLALALWSIALFQAEQGADDFDQSFATAAAAFDELLQLDPDRVTAQLNLTSLKLDWAASRLNRDLGVDAALDGVDRYLPSLRRAYPFDAEGQLARILQLRARQAALAGSANAGDLFDRAERQARAAFSEEVLVYTGEILVETLRRRAEFQATNDKVGEAMRAARDGVGVAQDIMGSVPELTNLWRARLAMEELLARHAEDAAGREQWYRSADDSRRRLAELEVR